MYVSSGSSTTRVATVGSGLPKTAPQTVTNVPGFPTDSGTGPYGYHFADLNSDPGFDGFDTLYVADDSAFALRKYSLVSGSWTLNGTIGTGSDQYRGLTATVSGSDVTLFATRKGGSGANGGGELVKLTDSTGYNGSFSGTPSVIATAASKIAFRGVALAPSNGTVTAADLTIAASAPANGSVGTNFDYTLVVNNLGGTSATGVVAQMTLPANLNYVSSTVAGGFSASYDGSTRVVSFTGGTIGATSSVTLKVTVTPTIVGTYSLPIAGAVVDPGNTVTESDDTNNSSALTVTTVVSAANTSPTIAVDTVTTTKFLSLPANGVGKVSGVISDPSDPARTLGIVFTVGDAESSASSLTVSASSGNSAVVTNANLSVTGTGASRTLKITPTGVGYATLTVTVNDGIATSGYQIDYAASAAASTPSATIFPTGSSDGSTAIAVDANYVLVGDDEDQALRLYSRTQSGLPVSSFDFTSSLGLTDISGGVPREVDIEAATKVGTTIYWMGSHNNASAGQSRPNRSRIFATTLSGSGAATTLAYAGRYDSLKSDLIAWDSSNGHGLGANYYGLAASAATGVIPEAADGSGFNIEGLTMAPDGTTAYVAFRAPISPASARTKALIVPVANFASLIGAGAGSATFGSPIELNLGGLGIREIQSNGTSYVIIAGPASGSGTFQLFSWTGNPADAAVPRNVITGLNPEGTVQVPAGTLTSSTQLQLVSDMGDTVYYGDSTVAKDLPFDNQTKFRIDTVSLGNAPLRIRDIQGTSHTSPLVGQVVANIPGIVTVVTSNGFYLQDSTPDSDVTTSEGIFIFTSSAPTVSVGHSVTVSGTVTEFQPGGPSTNNLTLTELVSPSVTIVSSGNPLPAPTVIGIGGRTPPTTVIDDDSFSLFDPASDGIDFYETLEGMRVQINNAVATGPTNRFGEISVLADNGVNGGLRTARGGIIVQPGDFNPERIIIDNSFVPTPNVNVGATFGTIVGVMEYNFGNFKLQVTVTPTASGGVTRETTTLVGASDALTVASFNAENLDPSDGATKFNSLASIIVNNMMAPDILTLEEIQDNNGATNNGVVDPSTTFNQLIAAITAAGGPTYEYRQINPVNNQDGGEPGGNIRVAFLFNPSRVSFIDRSGGTSTSSTTVANVGGVPQLSASPGRIDPNNSAFNSSRKPLVGEFLFAGEKVFVIANHWNSKGGDEPLFGDSQPPVLSSEVQRNQQAQIVQDFIENILAIDANARIVWGGDLNDFHFSNPVKILTGVADLVAGSVVPSGRPAILTDLVKLLPANEQYSYVFDGNSQDLDHILASSRLVAEGAQFDAVHVNSEFFDQISDHDPLVSRFLFQFAPTSISLSANTILENAPAETVIGTVTGTDPNLSDTIGFTLADDAGGRFALRTNAGVVTLVNTAGLNFEQSATWNIVVRGTDQAGKSLDQPFTINVTNVAYELTGFDVQKGQTQRSFVRYADFAFQDTTTVALQSLISGAKVQLLFLGTSGSGATGVNLTGKLSVSAGKLSFDAGSQGIGGNRNSNLGDGYYRFQLDLDFNGTFETTRTFFRLFGDMDGDRQTSQADRNLIPATPGPYNANLDVNGDGVVDGRDRIAIRLGRSLTLGVTIDD